VIFVTFDEKNILKMCLIFGKERGRVGRVVKEFFRGGDKMPSNQTRRTRMNFYQGIATLVFVGSLAGLVGSGFQAYQHNSYKPSYQTSSSGQQKWGSQNTATAIKDVGASFAGATAGAAASVFAVFAALSAAGIVCMRE
jgi:hypothetical protein